MAYTLDESFASGIPAGFAASHGAVIGATHVPAAEAVDLVFPQSQCYWRMESVPAENDWWFEYDVELMSRTFGAWHFGFWSAIGGTGEGYRSALFGAPTSSWSITTWSSFGSEFGAASSPADQTWLNPGARKVLRLDVKVLPESPVVFTRISVDGVEQFRDSRNAPYYPLYPSIFGYGCTLRVHRISGGSGSAIGDVQLTARGLPQAVNRLRGYEPPARPANRAIPSLLRKHHSVFSGPGKITGTVKEKGMPNVPVARKVLLLDQATHAVVADTFSDPLTGAYAFNQLSMLRKYVALSYDHEGDFRAVIADSLVPTP